MKLGHEISLALSIVCLVYIRTDRSAATNDLLRNNIFFFIFDKILIKLNNAHRKRY